MPRPYLISHVLCLCIALAGAAAAQEPVLERPAETAAEVLSGFEEDALNELGEKGVLLIERKDGSGTIEGLVVFSRPLARTWELLTQGDRQDEYRPELKGVRTVDASERHSVDEHELRIMFLSITYRLRYDFHPERNHIRWTLDPEFDNDVEHISGYWWLFEMEDGRTLGLFGTRVSVGAAMPGWLQDSVTRKKVPQTLERCRTWVDSDGDWQH